MSISVIRYYKYGEVSTSFDSFTLDALASVKEAVESKYVVNVALVVSGDSLAAFPLIRYFMKLSFPTVHCVEGRS